MPACYYVRWLQRKNTDGILDTQTDNAIYSELFILWGFVSRRVGSPAIDNTSFNRIQVTCSLLILFQSHFTEFVPGLSKPWRKEAVPTVGKKTNHLAATGNLKFRSGKGIYSFEERIMEWNLEQRIKTLLPFMIAVLSLSLQAPARKLTEWRNWSSSRGFVGEFGLA